jgi:D-glycero-beta-D-manno-heptose 1-phosphate adenylyltransferase
MGVVLQNDLQLMAWCQTFWGDSPSPNVLVTTNGCFDLLHVGHLRYLQASKIMGDALLLFVNSDASVQRLKGPSRPIVPQAERAEMLAGLACVDAVVLFDEDTPNRLLTLVKPTIHVKGSQYTPETLPEASLLVQLGIELRFANMVAGHSSSNIIDKIKADIVQGLGI